jgi:hypothetical protein
VTELHLRTLAGDPDDRLPTEADLATVDDAARLLERAYRRFEELRPTLTPEWLNTLLTLRAIAQLCTAAGYLWWLGVGITYHFRGVAWTVPDRAW